MGSGEKKGNVDTPRKTLALFTMSTGGPKVILVQ